MAILIFVIGLFFGSFLNVVVDRLQRDEKFTYGRSHCEHCKKNLSWNDLIPVFSFIGLHGRCRYCKTKLSLYYPVIEITTGILFVLIYLKFSFANFSLLEISTFIFYLFFVSVLIIVSFSDLKYEIIPNKVLAIGVIVSIIFIALSSLSSLPYLLLVGFLSFLFFFLLVVVTKGKGMGMGDAKFAFLIGFILGFPKVVLAFYLAFLTGAFVSIILILWGKKKLHGDTIPFGPFLALATVISVVLADPILRIIRAFLNF